MAPKKLTASQIIMTHRLNKEHLARRMGMPIGTFKNKVYDTLPMYHFTAEEEKRLLAILNEMAADIKNAKQEA